MQRAEFFDGDIFAGLKRVLVSSQGDGGSEQDVEALESKISETMIALAASDHAVTEKYPLTLKQTGAAKEKEKEKKGADDKTKDRDHKIYLTQAARSPRHRAVHTHPAPRCSLCMRVAAT